MSVAESWGLALTVRVRVPAKINLALRVGRARPDGYHELATIFQAVSLYDELTASAAPEQISCATYGVDADKIGPPEQNLAYRAAQLLKAKHAVSAGVRLRIDKRIPAAAGLAGGSADAAAALLACARLWDLPVSTEDLIRLAARLGADVPFPLMGGTAVGLGRGETLTPMLSRGQFHWVLALAGYPLSTPEVFRRHDQLTTGQRPPASVEVPRALMQALTAGDPATVAPLLVNDLHTAACSLAPALRATLKVGREAGCLGAVLSGSGPTIAFLAENEAAATDLAVAVSSEGVAKEVRLAVGPVPGATVLPD
jgi:4-diphosphocytidyl-2-C-methyl-D-erythritol kinase